MPEHVNIEAKTDREILIIAIGKLNTIQDQLKEGTVQFHDIKKAANDIEQRVTVIETRCATINCATTDKKKAFLIPSGVAAAIIGLYEIIRAIVSRPPA